MKIVLDMDPGVDDAIVLLLALNNPEIELVAVTTVSGNVSVSKATLNALKIIEASGKNMPPVYKGASGPLNKKWGPPVHAEDIHGSDGLGNSRLPIPEKLKPSKGKASDKILEIISTHKDKEISIVATGPMTNIAMLLKSDEFTARKINQISIMGGIYDNGITKGNVTKYAEFNFYSDPEAAQIVMNPRLKENEKNNSLRVVASGLDITNTPECAINKDSLERICIINKMKNNNEKSNRISDLSCRILQQPVHTFSYFNLHDVFALFSLIHPEIFNVRRCNVMVSCSKKFRGRCKVSKSSVAITSDKHNVLVCSKVLDYVKFNEYLFDGLS